MALLSHGTACPLCQAKPLHEPIRAHRRTYLACSTCELIFLNPAERLDPDAERAHYLTHQNDPTDARYRAFLDRLAIPLIEKVPPGAKGLDIGSGPGPTLSVMLEERGFDMTVYDPYFAPDAAALQRTYDFITATETVEHFYFPGNEFARLYDLMRPNAVLGIMTEMVTDERAFEKWHYPRDPTHVSFYRKSTMEWIASHFGFDAEFPRRNIVLFRRRS